MEWQSRDPSPHAGTWLLVTAGDAAAADTAVLAGADLLDVGPAGAAAIGEILGRHPAVPLCREWRPADLAGNAFLARSPGVRLICADVPAAIAAREAGVPHAAILVATRLPGVAAARAAGWDVVADVDHPPFGAPGILPGQAATVGQITPRQQNGSAGGKASGEDPDEVSAAVAAAAVGAWLGVTAVRTRHARSVRRALDMTESIRGVRPPVWAVRGLA